MFTLKVCVCVCVCRAREDIVSLISDPRVSLLTNGTIQLVNATHEDSGVYTCSVKHTDIFITANLEVFSKSFINFGGKQ